MGLLDYIGRGEYGGLLDSLLYQSPLLKPQEAVAGPQYDQMGSVISGAPQTAADPFGPIPGGFTQRFAPQNAPSVFNGMMPSAPVQQFGGAPAQPSAPVPAPVAAQPQPAAPPTQTMNIGGYQMPQIGNASDYMPQRVSNAMASADQPMTDVSAQSRSRAQPSFLDNPNAGFGDRLLAGANNFASADGILPALVGGISGLATGQRTDRAGINQQNLKAQYDSLVPILGQQKALLAVMNPEAGKTLLSEALTNKEKYQKIGSDALGNEQYGFVNDRDQTINGKPAAEVNAQSQSGGGFLAPGTTQIDSSLKGNDYLKQFSPEVQAAVQDYVEGKSMPTGNPRKGFTQTVKMIAQKYGQDTNQVVDDSTYGARRTMRNQLSSSAPSSLGGQINIGNTAAGHLADLTEQALKLGNYDTGIAPLTNGINTLRGLGTEQAAKMEALKGAAQHYGQEITKFYAGSPGGVAERDRFLHTVDGAKSPKELAAVLSTEAELMQSRLTTLGDQIKGVLGDEGLKQYPVIRPASEAAFRKIEENVSRLRGGQGAGTVSGLPSGWTVKVR